ncbi:hypothetical protein K402DRAFT_412293 [Aulographum hederae CBS 113979]|uniref:Tc1-like transposase DDE domain-containing protein n=1 Tax=Aulographum hederae CBS 113979 TaxID=1176131 RepID=A0A6G1H2A3_9PEZI|nr:hypothetical protein K402DRAFT_412293 [Aulographum hederae CBS 113979]
MPQTRSQKAISERNSQNASHQHFNTPKKARLRQAIKSLQEHGEWDGSYTKSGIFKELGISKTQGYAILRERSHTERTFPFGPEEETRGAKHVISRMRSRSMSWETVGYEAGLGNVSARTIQRAMGRSDYHKCVACRRGWVSEDLAKRRVEFAKIMLSKYPNPDQWKHVRFSDEVHFGLGPQGHLLIIRKPGERYCQDCIQEARDPREEDKKKLHAWAAVGYDFKSELVFYNIPTNHNGKMTMKVYEEEILDKHVLPWIQAGQNFVLEEDRDSGHGIGPNNRIKTWKATHGLNSYFNMSGSPDLSPIENAWQL